MVMRKAKQAIFKPEENGETGEKFLACFLPTDAAVKRIENGTDSLNKVSYSIQVDNTASKTY
jgi:hypothetical protein